MQWESRGGDGLPTRDSAVPAVPARRECLPGLSHPAQGSRPASCWGLMGLQQLLVHSHVEDT